MGQLWSMLFPEEKPVPQRRAGAAKRDTGVNVAGSPSSPVDVPSTGTPSSLVGPEIVSEGPTGNGAHVWDPWSSGEYTIPGEDDGSGPNPWVSGEYKWDPVIGPTNYAGNAPRAYYLSPINGRGEVIVRHGGQVQQNSLPIPLPSELLSFLQSPEEQESLLKTEKDKHIQMNKLKNGRSYSVFYSIPMTEMKSLVESTGKGVPVESLGLLSGPENILIGAEALARIKNMGHLSGTYEPVLLPAYGPAWYATKRREYMAGSGAVTAAIVIAAIIGIALVCFFIYKSHPKRQALVVPVTRG